MTSKNKVAQVSWETIGVQFLFKMGSRLTGCGDGSSGGTFRPGHNAFRNWPEEEKKYTT